MWVESALRVVPWSVFYGWEGGGEGGRSLNWPGALCCGVSAHS